MSPVFLEMIYMLPEHRKLVQVIMFKINDEAPDYPKSHELINNMKGSIEGKILNYRVINKDEYMRSEEYKDILDLEDKDVTIH